MNFIKIDFVLFLLQLDTMFRSKEKYYFDFKAKIH